MKLALSVRGISVISAAALAAAGAGLLVAGSTSAGSALGRLEALAKSTPDRVIPMSCGDSSALQASATESAGNGTLASWQTIGGCGAGASSGAGAGIKWVGRSVSGGLFQVQCQGNYGPLDDGYFYAANTMVNRDLGEKWNLGVNAAWLYKYWYDPTGFGYDISNEGWGDVAVMLTRRLGATNATNLTLTVGLPTGGYKADSKGYVLRQDKQMGHGKFTSGLMLDHVFDNLWGPVVVGGTVDYRGGENKIGNYRSPAASLYSYAAYLLGPFAPAAGVTLIGFQARDRDQTRVQDRPLVTVAANASIEWSSDYVALLVGGSLPFDVKGNPQPWVAGVGLTLAPF
ncbi:MAG TPA: hypothetical protein VGG33_08435 [Polyangia bacterium]